MMMRLLKKELPHEAYASHEREICNLLDLHCLSEGATLFEKMSTARSLDPRVRLQIESALLMRAKGEPILAQVDQMKKCRKLLSMSLKRPETPALTMLRFVLAGAGMGGIYLFVDSMVINPGRSIDLLNFGIIIFMICLGIGSFLFPRVKRSGTVMKPSENRENPIESPIHPMFCGGVPYYSAVAMGLEGEGVLSYLKAPQIMDTPNTGLADMNLGQMDICHNNHC